jgi:methyltransferase (TIGR00027 family)
MKAQRASVTAKFVAGCRGLGVLLPKSAQLVTDPYGARAVGAVFSRAVDAVASGPAAGRALAWGPLLPLLPWAVYMQIRTRAIDDALRAFVAQGGAQVVILGAGFDARSLRMGPQLDAVTFFEVDHPATAQARLERFGPAHNARAIAWNFEQDAMSALPARLASLGHDPSRPTFTVWEGVTMYLTPEAFSATLDAVREYSAAGSTLAFNYVVRSLVERPSLAARAVKTVVRAVGEPFKLGFAPDALREALERHGFALQSDRDFFELARALLPPPWSALVGSGRRIVLVERSATAGVV